MGQRESTGGKVFTFLIANSGFIPSTSYNPQSMPQITPEPRICLRIFEHGHYLHQV